MAESQLPTIIHTFYDSQHFDINNNAKQLLLWPVEISKLLLLISAVAVRSRCTYFRSNRII